MKETGRLAILSYHRWETAPDTLIANLAALRDNGRRALSLAEAERFYWRGFGIIPGITEINLRKGE